MSIKALKETLLDFKKQMRGRRGAAYIRELAEGDDDDDAGKDTAGADDPKPSAKAEEPKAAERDDSSDLSEQMKIFMRRKARPAPARAVSVVGGGRSAPPPAKPKADAQAKGPKK